MKALALENQRLYDTTKNSQRAIYHGMKSDRTDMALSRILNNFPER